MQFKTILFLSFFSILLFQGCNSKDEKDITTKIKEVKKTEFTLKTVDNSNINLKLEDGKIILKNYPNKIVLLNFFATWCPPCKAEIPNLIHLQNIFKNDFVVIGVLLEDNKSNEDIKSFMNKFKINYEIVNSKDNFELAKSLGNIQTIPTMYLVDKKSNIYQKYVGLVPSEMMEIDLKKIMEK